MSNDFLKVHSFNGTIHLVNKNQIAHVYERDKNAVLVLTTIDKNGKSTEIIDSIKGMESWTELLIIRDNR